MKWIVEVYNKSLRIDVVVFDDKNDAIRWAKEHALLEENSSVLVLETNVLSTKKMKVNVELVEIDDDNIPF